MSRMEEQIGLLQKHYEPSTQKDYEPSGRPSALSEDATSN
jgi:hypothetical protein